MIADSDSSAIQVESSKGDREEEEEEEEEENFYTSFLVGLVRGLSDGARLKGPSTGGGWVMGPSSGGTRGLVTLSQPGGV